MDVFYPELYGLVSRYKLLHEKRLAHGSVFHSATPYKAIRQGSGHLWSPAFLNSKLKTHNVSTTFFGNDTFFKKRAEESSISQRKVLY